MTQIRTTEIKHIIFDLGGVLLNINPLLSLLELEKISGIGIETLQNRLVDEGVFEMFDTGNLSPVAFRREMCRILNRQVSDAEIDRVWNLLLLDFPHNRVEMLLQIRKNYHIYLLSNTNSIHFEKYTHDFYSTHGFPFADLFHRMFLSYEIGIHKPDEGIYTYVLEHAGIKAAETVFFDDSLANIRAAEQLGIQSIHIRPGCSVTDFFENGLLK